MALKKKSLGKYAWGNKDYNIVKFLKIYFCQECQEGWPIAQECECGKGPNAIAESHAGPLNGHTLHLPFPQWVGRIRYVVVFVGLQPLKTRDKQRT